MKYKNFLHTRNYDVPLESWRKGKKRVVKTCHKDKEKIVYYGAKGYEDFTTHKDPEK